MNKYSKYVNTEKIKEIRTQKHIPVREIIARMGLSSRTSYYYIENGVVEPKITHIVMLSTILDEPIENLFNFNS